MSENLNKFKNCSLGAIALIAIGACILLFSNGDDSIIIPTIIICGFLAICFYIAAFYALAYDIVDKKGYTQDDIPNGILILINIVMGPFIFVYLMALPSKNNATIVEEDIEEETEKQSWVCCFCGEENDEECSTCANCNNSKSSELNWTCPKCESANYSDDDVCSNCGYQK